MMVPVQTMMAVAKDGESHVHAAYVETMALSRGMRVTELPPAPLLGARTDDVLMVDGPGKPFAQKITLRELGHALVSTGSLPPMPDDGLSIMELADMIATLPPELRGAVAGAFFLVVGRKGRRYDPAEFHERCRIP